MNQRSERLLEAHTDFVCAQYAPGQIEGTLRKHGGQLFDFAAHQPLESLVDRSWLKERILAALRETRAAGLVPFAAFAQKKLAEAAGAGKETAGDLVRKVDHDRIVDILIESKGAREEMARDFARSMFFRRMISEVLFFSIRRFLGEDNVLAKSVPGVSSLFKIGQNLVNQAMPNLDENISKGIKDFIGKNMDHVVRYTETVLTGQMDDRLVRELADSFYEDFKSRPVAGAATDFLQSADRANTAAEDFWNHLKSTDFASRMILAAVDAWFEFYGKKTAAEALGDAGWDREKTVTILAEAARKPVTAAVESGFLKAAVRAELALFYSSPEAAAILD